MENKRLFSVVLDQISNFSQQGMNESVFVSATAGQQMQISCKLAIIWSDVFTCMSCVFINMHCPDQINQ